MLPSRILHSTTTWTPPPMLSEPPSDGIPHCHLNYQVRLGFNSPEWQFLYSALLLFLALPVHLFFFGSPIPLSHWWPVTCQTPVTIGSLFHIFGLPCHHFAFIIPLVPLLTRRVNWCCILKQSRSNQTASSKHLSLILSNNKWPSPVQSGFVW